MSESKIDAVLKDSGLGYEIFPCDPELADTGVFCEQYGYPLDHSANTIIVKGKTGEERYIACVVLADMRLDVNKIVRKRMNSRRVSFASADETRALTGMEIGGVTPLTLPANIPVWVDATVMMRDYIILGGGSRDRKIKVSPQLFRQLEYAEVVEDLAYAMV